MPPGDAYWAFFHAKRGGSWVYSSSGVASYDPAPGSVVGFRFGSGQQPGIAPPAATKTSAPTPTKTTSKPKPTTVEAQAHRAEAHDAQGHLGVDAPPAGGTSPDGHRQAAPHDVGHALGERHGIRRRPSASASDTRVGEPERDGIRPRGGTDVRRRRRRQRPGHPHRRRCPRGAGRRWRRLGRLEATRLTR